MKCAATSLSSKLIARQKEFFSELVVDAVSLLDDMLPLNMIGIKKVTGGSLEVRGKREGEGLELREQVLQFNFFGGNDSNQN